MKKSLVVFILLFTIIACKQRDAKSAGERTISATDDSTKFTTIQWIGTTHHEMGTVRQGEEIEIPFRFKNTGDKPLVIESARPGCGCTGAEKPEEPILPGQEGVIKAKFSSKGFEGSQTKYVTVIANTKNGTEHSLSFTVNVEKNK